MTEDTIVAIATPPGRGGIGVVRLAGHRAIQIALELVRLGQQPPEPQRSTLGAVLDPETGKVLDEVMFTCFRRPHSYTGEDVAAISCHGSSVILGFLVECCLARGARAAEPGEFTLRAFLNGRMDLTQAEAVRDLIEARTLYQARVAATQLEGALSARLKPHKQSLVELIARLEAGIDFADDDVEVIGWPEILKRLDAIRADLKKLVEGYDYGRIVREGLSLSIVGRPNVGKSSLFNRLLKMDRAIVTPTPGTTRDLVTETASIGGIPLRLVDTAGIRNSSDDVEKMGVERSHQAMADSDLRLLVVDSSRDWTQEDAELLRRTQRMGFMLVAANKADLEPRNSAEIIAQSASTEDGEESPPLEIISTSALTGQGVEELRDKILQAARAGENLGSEGDLVTNLRHQQLLKASVAALERCGAGAGLKVHHEMLLLDLYDALLQLDALTGATGVEDILGTIFSKFCIGK